MGQLHKMRNFCTDVIVVVATTLGILVSGLSSRLLANNRQDQAILKVVAPLVKVDTRERPTSPSPSGLKLQFTGDVRQLPTPISYAIAAVDHDIDPKQLAEEGLAPGLYQLLVKEKEQDRFQHNFLALAGFESDLIVNYAKETGYSLRQVLSLPQIQFQKSKPAILKTSHADLLVLSAVLKAQNSITRLDIEVHTDARGEESSNLSLTQARADEIGKFLVANGVGKERLRLQGWGSSKPLALGSGVQDRYKNRRVEYVIAELSPIAKSEVPLTIP